MKMQKLRQMVAMFLCILLVSNLTLPSLATATDSNAESESETQQIVLASETDPSESGAQEPTEESVPESSTQEPTKESVPESSAQESAGESVPESSTQEPTEESVPESSTQEPTEESVPESSAQKPTEESVPESSAQEPIEESEPESGTQTPIEEVEEIASATNAICQNCGMEPCECQICDICGEKSCKEHLNFDASISDDMPKKGDIVWIVAGSSVYKNTNDKNGYVLKNNYEIKIVEIVVDEDGAPIWFKFKFNNLGWGEIGLAFLGYDYVQVENTSTEELPPLDSTDEYACDCGNDAPENLADHADSCPRKQYIESLFEGKDAEDLCSDWEDYDEDIQNDILNMLEVYDEILYEELIWMLEGEEKPNQEPEEELIEPIDESVYGVAFAGAEGAMVTAMVASEEVAHVFKRAPESSSRHHISWRGVYDIDAEEGTEITVNGLPEIGTKIIEIRHYLDSAEAVAVAIADGEAHYLSVTGFEEHFVKEIAALKAVVTDAADDEICYVVLSSEDGQVTIMDDTSISFYADSYSYYEIGEVYYSPIAFTNAAPFDPEPVVESEDVETSKTVVYDEETDSFKLVLESYVTGSTTTITATSTKATDFVISLDTSHSMDECINCGGANTDSVTTGAVGKYTRCPIYAPDLDITATYYRGTSSGSPVTYCADCKGWFESAHWKDDGTHGSIDDVRYLPWENASSKDKTVARIGDTTFYEDHICTDNCETECALVGTRVPVYSTDPGFSTDKTYFRDANTSHTAVTYVCTYCDICGKWVSNYHCTGGTQRDSATYKFYEDHVCTEECTEDCELAGTRVLVDTTSPEFSTEKEYYTSSNPNNTSATYVIKFCSMCERWFSGNHGHSASTGTKRIPYERGTYGKTVYDLFHVPCISLMNGAKDAISAFIDEVYEMSKGPDGVADTEDDVHHRVALTGFSGGPDNGRVAIDYRPYKGNNDSATSAGNTTWTRSGIFSVWNPDVEEAKQWYPFISDFTGTIEQQNFVSYWNIDSSTREHELARAEYFYSHALRDVTSEIEMAVLEEGMEDYNYEYGTETHYGVIMADKIFQHNYDPDRNRVYILFTDGEPATDANPMALAAASTIKNNELYDATIYSIGTFSKASAQDIFPLPSLSTNKFMTLLSSNFTNNKTTTYNAAGKKYSVDDINPILWMKDSEGNYVTNTNGERVFNVWRTDENYEYVLDADGNKIPRSDKGAYYLTADDGDSLKKAFESVAQSSTTGGAQIEMSAKTVVQDVMSADWTLDVDDDVAKIEAYTMTYLGNITDENGKTQRQWKRLTEEEGGEITTLEVESTTITIKENVIEDGVGVEKEFERDAVKVTGFDFTANYVGIDKTTENDTTIETPRGKKLVIEIPIKPTEGNAGGKAQKTNTTAKSGIILDGTMIENFDSPAVDLPINVTFQKILENGDLNQNFAFNMSWKSFGGYDDKDNVGANANYLKTMETAKNLVLNTRPGNITTLANLVAGSTITVTEQVDSNYMVEVSIDGGQTFLAAPLEVGSVTNAVVDSESDEELVPEEEEIIGDGNDSDGNNSGDDENGEVEDSIEDEEDISELEYSLKLIRNSDGSVTAEIDVLPEMGIVFRNTLLLTDLTITKTLSTPALENQVFLFHLRGNDDNTTEYAVDVVVTVAEGETTGRVTIKDVLVGEYMVSEDQDWAWRYDLSDECSESLTKTLVTNILDNEFQFTNVRKETQWLTNDSYCENWWGGILNDEFIVIKKEEDPIVWEN